MRRRYIGSALAALVATFLVGSCATESSRTGSTGIRLEIEGSGEEFNSLPEIQEELRQVGVGVWPLPLSDVPEELQQLLDESSLTEAETAGLLDYFLLPRERLLEIVSASGRTPNVSDGGALETTVSNQDYGYPQLWVVQEGVDYTRFDRFHVNVAEDGTGVDEVLQMVSGEGVVVRVQRSSGTIHNLRLDCPASDVCWMISYDGGQSHVGSLSSATPGTKLVVQAFGPSEWALRYTDGDD